MTKKGSTVFSTEGKMDISSILWTLQREQADDKGHPLRASPIVSTPSFFSKSSLFVWFSPTHPLFPPEFWAKWRKLHKDLQAWSGWNILLCSGDQVPRMYLHGSSRIHHEFTHSIGEKEQFFISFKISCWPTLTL